MTRKHLRFVLACVCSTAPVLLGLAPAPLFAQHDEHGPGPAPDGEEVLLISSALGPYSRTITTDSEKAQAYFTQGLQLMYAFTPSDANRSFKEAQRHDPECAMCYFGEAWSLGRYLNGAMLPEDAPTAYAAIHKAKELAAESGTAIERALIDAMIVRYAPEHEGDEQRLELDEAYAAAMGQVWEAHPDDIEVGTFYGESLMLLQPRRGYWDIENPEVQKIHRVLEATLALNIAHPGACHLYVHATEPTTRPGKAEACADHLGQSIPGASHIQHMPSHTYNRIGRWHDAVIANTHAWHSDQKANHDLGYAIYPSHNLHMLLFAASMAGEGAVAMQASRNYGKLVSGGNFYESLTGVRFGFWEDVLAIEEQPEQPLFAGFWDFGRGFAHLRMERPDSAAFYMERLKEARSALDDEAPFRGHSAVDLITVVGGILEGEMLAAEGDVDGAVRVLEEAIKVEDGLRYDEPEPLNFAARHWLGAILNDAGRHSEAEEVFRAALEDHPHNGWSLFGLERALRAQGRDAEADETLAERMEYWANADVWLMSARF